MARKDRGGSGSDIDPNAWMATFADLLSLLLTFFVLLYAMKSLDQGKIEEMLGYFRRGGIGILFPGSHMPLITPDAIGLKDPTRQLASPADIQKLLMHRKFNYNVGVSSEDRGLVMTISSGIFFPFGTKLQPDSKAVLDEIIGLIQKGDFSIQVAGHTDRQPPNHPIYKTNWELSIARAASVARHIVKTGVIDPARLSVVGYADTRPLDTKDEGGNSIKNNRVELILLN
ncbi:MAG: flagellar motor protein MotB [Nitrospiria bacterium]